MQVTDSARWQSSGAASLYWALVRSSREIIAEAGVQSWLKRLPNSSLKEGRAPPLRTLFRQSREHCVAGRKTRPANSGATATGRIRDETVCERNQSFDRSPFVSAA